MEFKFIDKTFYDEIAPISLELAILHAKSRTDLFFEPVLMTKKDFRERIKIKGFVGIAAYENDVLVGYYFCRIKSFKSQENANSKSLWIDELFVCPEYRRSGYGTEIFTKLKEIAKENDCFIIEFDVWQLNDTAQSFYDSLGCKTQKVTKELIL